uniref:Helicase ATP-binding domain-containing protein n=1 Tax=viral metagenome TaxID=1070528 RepID=A0A6C0E012_9ZZZZ
MTSKMDYTKLTVNNFIYKMIEYNNIDEILDIFEKQREKGIMFERIGDIIIKFGFCEIFSNSQFTHKTGNANNGKLKTLESYNDYLNEKVNSSNSSGCSDITLYDRINKKYIFISSKYPKSQDDIKKQKSVDFYDLAKIIAVIEENKHIYKENTKPDIYLLVSNKKSVLEKVKKANKSSNYITKHMTEEKIIDKADLDKYFLKFKAEIIKQKELNEKINYDELFLGEKENLNLRFHQELITQKTLLLIEKGHKCFLWGCKCRSGKTYMAGGIIKKLYDIRQKLNVLIVTPAPTETIPQFIDDLFNKFRDFLLFKIHNIRKTNEFKTMTFDTNNIFIISKQLIDDHIDDKTITKIKNQNLDIIIFDEIHFTGCSDLSKKILQSYVVKKTIKIYLTATYGKPLNTFNITKECQMYWDIEDEQICKSIVRENNKSDTNINRLVEKHGNIVKEVIEYKNKNGYTIKDIFTPYLRMPDLHLITNMFEKKRYDIINENIKGSKYGFSFDTLFSLNKDKKFNYKKEVKIFLRYISGSEKEQDYKSGDKSIFTRIYSICTRHPFTHIWYLPSDNINDISQNLKTLMMEDKILKNYNVVCINRKNDDLAKDVKEEITKYETIAKAEGKDGLILLAGNMLTLGITINSCDIVMLMYKSSSFDKTFQQMYRCMTEGDNKQMGFVVDLDINRVVDICINYPVYKNSMNNEDKIKYLIENHLINIDVDMMENKQINSERIVKELMNVWKENPGNSIKLLLKRIIDTDDIEVDDDCQKLLNTYNINLIKGDNINIKIEIKDLDDEQQEMPTGKVKTRIDNTISKKTDDKKEEININIKKDILPYVIPLVCILTIKDKNKDFITMLNMVKKNKELLEIFDEMCIIWWNKKGQIDFMKHIIENFANKEHDIFNISIQIKMSLECLLDKPIELLELINDCLKPKIVEKKSFGEVFTPMNFINDKMLKDIEDYWLSKYNKNIWEDDTLTFYDPASGMGNYPIAIYYKLFAGLAKIIPNDEERKKHIIEKQLYMGELNKKNCFVIKQIFNINNEYKLNLYEGNTLEIDIYKAFRIKKFNVIIGNPPYNEELTRIGAKPLYNKFIEYYLDKCNMLSFVVPSRWFAGGKGLDKFREMMINRTDILYIKHYDDACKIFGNTVSIEGGVNYFLMDIDYNGLCDYNGAKVKLNNFDIVLDSKYYNIVNKFLNFDTITKLYKSQDYHKIQTNDKRLIDENKKDYLKCYVSQQKGFIKYIDKKEIKTNISKYKVLTPDGNGSNKCFGNLFIGYPNEVHCKTYISFETDTEQEAKSLLSYMKCKFPNFMLSLRKISQHTSAFTCKWIPLVPLNKEWTDDEVYKYFKLSEDEIKLVKETKVIGYNDIKTDNINEPKIIKDGRKQYYLVGDKLYKVKKDKSQGELFGSYIDNKIIDDKNNQPEIIKPIKQNNEIKKISENKKIIANKKI